MYAILVVIMLLGSAVMPQLGIRPSEVSFQTSTSGAKTTLTPVADTYVSASAPTKNFNGERVLRADQSPDMRTYMRFDIPSGIGTISRVTLRVRAEKNQSAGLRVYLVPNVTWGESQLTAANAPSLGATMIGQSGKLINGSWATVDVTAAVTGSGPFSLALVSASTADLTLASRETWSRAPQLVIETGETTDPSSPTPTPGPAPSPTPSPTPPPVEPSVPNPVAPRPGVGSNAVAPGAMNLTSTFNSIGIELLFTGDDNQNSIANLEFRRSGDSSWRQGLPLWGTYSNPRAFYGSALLLDAGTTYEIRVSFTDPDGVNGNFNQSGSITTQAEDIPAANSLSPTHFVSEQGNDANEGTSPNSAWKTLEKAFTSAPAGAIVRVAPGSYAPPSTNRTTPITVVAENPAVDDGQNIINDGKRSVIEPQTISAPNSGVWQSVKLNGPATGQGYTVWKWTGSPVEIATELAWSSSRTDEPQRVAYWNRQDGTFKGYTMETPEGWAEVLYRNDSYNFGFTSFGSDIYLRLPGDRNPNDVFVTVHNSWMASSVGRVVLSGSNVRLSGFEIRLADVMLQAPSVNGVVDHNLFYSGTIYFKGETGSPSTYPTDQVVQYNRMIDTSLYSTEGGDALIPWLFVKQNLKIDGESSNWRRIGESAELHAIEGRGGANQLVVRRNTIEGYFNGVGANSTDFDRYSKTGTDIYDNTFRRITDDVIEPEDDTINWRIWSNRMEYVSVVMSTGPVDFGPIYFFRNEVWMLSNKGVGVDKSGDSGVGSNGFKYSGKSNPLARVYVIHNTFWTNWSGADGGQQAAGGGDNTERFYLRNNIFRMTRYAFASPGSTGGWNEDYNFFYTSDPSRGINYGTRNYSTVSSYRAASGQGVNTNLADTSDRFRTEPVMVDPAGGNLQLANGSPQIDAGVPVPNISDRAGIDYSGAAPDMGALER